jgi:transcriptional regulator with XRE-family HTH domain
VLPSLHAYRISALFLSREVRLKSRPARGKLKVDLAGIPACQNRGNIFLTCPLLQGQLAERMGRSQQWISDIERAQHGVSVVEFLEFAEALGFDPRSRNPTHLRG